MIQVQNRYFAMNWNAKYIERLLFMILLVLVSVILAKISGGLIVREVALNALFGSMLTIFLQIS